MSTQYAQIAADAVADALNWETRARNAEHACREAYRLLIDPDTALSARDIEVTLYDVLKNAGMT